MESIPRSEIRIIHMANSRSFSLVLPLLLVVVVMVMVVVMVVEIKEGHSEDVIFCQSE